MRKVDRLTLATCAALLVLYYVVSLCAVLTKSPTADELNHAFSAYFQAYREDFRMAPEVPPLWHYWTALPMALDPPNIPPDSHLDRLLTEPWLQWNWIIDVSFHTPGNDADRIVNRLRAMTLVYGVGLGALIAWWGYKLGGRACAIVACAVFALDPNFMGHGALVKNDVAFTFTWLWAVVAIWLIGSRVSVWRVINLGLACGACLGVKATGLLVPPILIGMLCLRAGSRTPWIVRGMTIENMRQKFIAAAVVTVAAGLIAWVVLWAGYGFRYSITSDPSARMDRAMLFDRMKIRQAQAAGKPLSEMSDWRPPTTTRIMLWMTDHYLIPDAYATGYMITEAMNTNRLGYLLGEEYVGARPSYFPIAFGVKTPLVTLCLILVAAMVLVSALRARRASTTKRVEAVSASDAPSSWTFLCLLLPTVIYFVVAAVAGLNIGQRHIFPIYPPLFLMIGIAASKLVKRYSRRAAAGFGVALLLLAAENAMSFPDYIAYFNVLAGGPTGGRHVLADSNLDWGQDLKPLAAWRKVHPEGRLYLSYWSIGDPNYYGIDYTPITGSNTLNGDPVPLEKITDPGYIAVSITNLQGLYLSEADNRRLEVLRRAEPLIVIGGTIYVYKYEMP